MKPSFLRRAVVFALVAFSSACTMKNEERPALAGPSEFGTSITISVTPDVIQQDGASQSVVTVTARGPNGQALANVALRAEIRVDGVPTDFGGLSARNLVTGSDGRATLVYTAPAAPSGLVVDTFTVVDIGITPLGSDFGNTVTRFASLRLIPRGTVVVPSNLRPSFTFSPTSPLETQTVLFDASTSTAPANNPIVSYSWDFDDGTTGTGRTTSHAFNEGGTYVVTLTVADALGRTAESASTITVQASGNPVANFVFSPTAPLRGTVVTFNGQSSTAAAGRRIVRYVWDFGDPADRTAAEGPQPSHRFISPGTYNVTLTVTDDLGRTNTRSTTVTVS